MTVTVAWPLTEIVPVVLSRPMADALTLAEAVVFSVTEAAPLASVVAVAAGARVPAVVVKVTTTPGIGLSVPLVTEATRVTVPPCAGNCVPPSVSRSFWATRLGIVEESHAEEARPAAITSNARRTPRFAAKARIDRNLDTRIIGVVHLSRREYNSCHGSAHPAHWSGTRQHHSTGSGPNGIAVSSPRVHGLLGSSLGPSRRRKTVPREAQEEDAAGVWGPPKQPSHQPNQGFTVTWRPVRCPPRGSGRAGVQIGVRPHCRWTPEQWRLTPILTVLSSPGTSCRLSRRNSRSAGRRPALH